MMKLTSLKTFAGFLFLGLLFSACGFEETELEKRRKADDERIKSFLSENNIDATRDQSGIYYEVLATNATGEDVEINDVVSIYYSMTTLDGVHINEVNSSQAPVRFLHDYQSIIPLGLDYAVQLMRKGEKFRFYIPSTLAYGEYSNEDVFEPNTIFIIEVEIVGLDSENEIYQWEQDSIQSYLSESGIEGAELQSSGLFYKLLEEGTGRQPLEYNKVTFYFKRSYLDSTIIEETSVNEPVTIPLNQGYAVEGLEQGLKKMKEGGKALLIMPSAIGFKSSVQVIPARLRDQLLQDGILQHRVEPYAPIMYEVELLDVF